MANTLLTISMITREALRVLENNLKFFTGVRKDFDDSFGKTGAKIGTVLNIRKPPRYVGRRGQALQIEDATETFVPLALNTQYGCDLAFTSSDLSLSIDDFADRFIKPAVANVANGIDFDGTGQYLNVFNFAGIPGTIPNALFTYLTAAQRLDEQATPRDGRRTLAISPGMQAAIIDALKGLFQASTDIASQYRRGVMGETIDFEWVMDQNVRTQVIGAQGGTPVVAGAGQTGNVIATSGWTPNALVLNQGDIIQFAGVFAVNPQNRQSTGAPANWVVTANVQATATGLANIPISGPGGQGVVTAGPFQTCTAPPANNAAVTVFGAANTNSPQGLAYHKDAFAWGCADLLLPGGVHHASRVSDKQLGISIRMVQAYDINTDRFPCRLDVLGGWTTLYPELACRVAS
jgi:hypothetical protein